MTQHFLPLSRVNFFVIFIIIGIYSFKVELTQLTAAASVELWISTDADPLSIQRILSVIHVDMVSE